MVKLKDYLGTLISGVNQARVMADVESARIAQAYASDNILKHFPVPRFRAQDVELDIPIAIDSFDQQPAADYQPVDNKSFNSNTYTSMKDAAQRASFSRKTSTFLNSEIAEKSKILEQEMKANESKELAFSRYEEKMTAAFSSAMDMEKIPAADQDKMIANYKDILKNKVYASVKTRQVSNTLENANVVVDAARLREIPNENIIRIKMKLFEDGMEWHTSEDVNGNQQSSLLPE
ncbi:hypothetical protein LY01_01571 [Nonlabens xylanidelens]|uniref:Uncharacterized protein n=1 Tax=Nonlabens xylanidelens TaxID=191564 RepID=A0A2S6IKT9_9FLAO|nr:hypothetical protein [Nonlabens xylanidelens]PPK94818.1 hypothetical protein LY01_01571 [Nonlabens xylanidelens]PQJ17375.1 hypothetical protein BST94_09940 [Nonlabens xylanidelens]